MTTDTLDLIADRDQKIAEFTTATADVANLLQPFFDGLRVDHQRFDIYLSMALGDTSLKEDIPAIKAAIRRRADAQEAMLAAIGAAGFRKAGA